MCPRDESITTFSPLGEVELISTHDQILGGATGQAYVGCRFPADSGPRRGEAEWMGRLFPRAEAFAFLEAWKL